MAPPNQVLSLGHHLDASHRGAHGDLDLADLEHDPWLHDRLGHARPLNLRAVGGAEIADVYAVGRSRQLAMVARHGVVGEDEVVVGGLADSQPVADAPARALCVAGHDNDLDADRGLARLQRARCDLRPVCSDIGLVVLRLGHGAPRRARKLTPTAESSLFSSPGPLIRA